ncbi:hypothetical protein F3Y22_tig00110483pilonHSYRG00053 [Hibiscus syriacus]|uniref:Uncharacterized protein n=1 Tax=Hibiscus syriacus TaxID=106335 RepID=A0A6A3ACP9_HIBSY|nr:hypothetical protein F3Y22_tig00110483pilonHSYRG00053 [Hibiscus syriacus]
MPTTVPSDPRPQVPTGETIPSSLLAKASSSSVYDPNQQSLISQSTVPTPSQSPLLPQDPDKNSLQLSPERTRDRRKVVRIAWEKLVRWSRSWRSRAKTDVLERTKKATKEVVKQSERPLCDAEAAQWRSLSMPRDLIPCT